MKKSKLIKSQAFSRPTILIALLLSLITNILLYSKWQSANGQIGTYNVIKVIDGDSIIVEGNQTIRLASVAAPELEYCLGKQSKKFVSNLIYGKRVKVEITSRDSYSRLMGLVYIDGELINEKILESGMGRYDSSQTSKDDILLKAEHRAKEKKIGVFSSKCSQTVPPNKECNIKANIDKKRGQRIYHYPGCTNYNDVIVELDRGERWFCTEKQARVAKFIKSGQCFK